MGPVENACSITVHLLPLRRCLSLHPKKADSQAGSHPQPCVLGVEAHVQLSHFYTSAEDLNRHP